MNTDMSVYGVTELTREEASSTSGGWLLWALSGAFSVAVIIAGILELTKKKS